MTLEAACDLLQPTIMSHIMDDGIRNSRIDTVLRLGALMLGITALGACFAAIRNILASKVSQKIGADLRYDVFSKIIHFSEISADKIESGSLITRTTNDTNQIIQFINDLMRIFVKAPIICLGSMVLAVLLSRKLGLVLLSAVAVVAVLIVISITLSYERFAKVQYAIDKVNTVVQEYLLGIRLVKAFGRFSDEEKKFDVSNRDLYEKSLSSQLIVAYFSPAISLAINLGIVAIVYLGSIFFGRREIKVGKISAFTTYMAQILSSLMMIINVFNSFVRTKASTERIGEVMGSEEDLKGSERLEDREGGLEFSGVTFAYPHGSGLPAIKDLSFQVNRGEMLAIIGPTGSGKSTVAWLCLHFYDITQGAICLNGGNIASMDIDQLRDSIALAAQKSMLFTGTVYDNIAWGNPEADKEEIHEAARMAQAEEFILGMKDGYNSALGQGGVNLSGGQKQRISIARALVKKSPVLILDDCTSALDSVTEAKVRRALHSLGSRKMVIIITQRIGTAMSADRILVLDNGSKAGFGTHRELLRSCRIYRDIFESQIGEDLIGEQNG
ncbi:putative ABC transporter ATP-binding protein [bioreactor metagenome]|uniref:Putative ABC transporter ATP-binding protein n=1 Tax=bioreactor metagenome TaxID=1076179 RepID=A0A644Y6B6_9ZZZZ